jgi:hypothetical protein
MIAGIFFETTVFKTSDLQADLGAALGEGEGREALD